MAKFLALVGLIEEVEMVQKTYACSVGDECKSWERRNRGCDEGLIWYGVAC